MEQLVLRNVDLNVISLRERERESGEQFCLSPDRFIFLALPLFVTFSLVFWGPVGFGRKGTRRSVCQFSSRLYMLKSEDRRRISFALYISIFFFERTILTAESVNVIFICASISLINTLRVTLCLEKDNHEKGTQM